MLENEFDRKLKLTEESIDRFGSYLLGYAHSLCKNTTIDADILYANLWIYVLNKFKEENISHVGFLRRKLYCSFADEWRKMQRSPLVYTETIPERTEEKGHDSSLTDEQIKAAFFKDHPVDLTEKQKQALFLWALEDKTYAEISKILGVPLSTIGDWVKRGRKAIIDYIEN